MNDHVAKPIDPAVLFDTIGRYYGPASGPGAGATPPAGAPPGAATTSGPTAGTPIGDATVPSVEGLDTASGLMRVAGNRKLYLKLLRQFVDQQGQAPARITDALASSDHATAERLAHTVKGVAGNLGAGVVQAAAGALEQAIAGRGDSDHDPPGRIAEISLRIAHQLTRDPSKTKRSQHVRP